VKRGILLVVSVVCHRRLEVCSLLWTGDGDFGSVFESPSSECWSPAAVVAVGGVLDEADRTACGRHRGTRVATEAPACRPV